MTDTKTPDAQLAQVTAERDRLRAVVVDLVATFESAIKIIRDHVPADALGVDDNGMEAPLCQSWPILDEVLYHFDECIKDAQAALSAPPPKPEAAQPPDLQKNANQPLPRPERVSAVAAVHKRRDIRANRGRRHEPARLFCGAGAGGYLCVQYGQRHERTPSGSRLCARRFHARRPRQEGGGVAPWKFLSKSLS